jgi:hypothetical protein
MIFVQDMNWNKLEAKVMFYAVIVFQTTVVKL